MGENETLGVRYTRKKKTSICCKMKSLNSPIDKNTKLGGGEKS